MTCFLDVYKWSFKLGTTFRGSEETVGIDYLN